MNIAILNEKYYPRQILINCDIKKDEEGKKEKNIF